MFFMEVDFPPSLTRWPTQNLDLYLVLSNTTIAGENASMVFPPENENTLADN